MNHPQIPENSPLFVGSQVKVGSSTWYFSVLSRPDNLLAKARKSIAHIAALEWRVAGRPDIAEQWEKWGRGEPWEPYPAVPESEFFRGGHFRYPGELVVDIATASGKERKLIAIVAMHECFRAFRKTAIKADAAKWHETVPDWCEWGGLS